MQREIAHVMASCAMRGMRYISFPPIVFETPVHMPATNAEAPEAQPDAALPEAATPMLDGVMAAPVAPTVDESPSTIDAPPVATPPATPPAITRHLAGWAEQPLETAPPTAPGRLRRLSELAASESLAPGDPERRPRYALLNDIAVELRPRRQRARGGQSENQAKPNPTSQPWP